MLAVVEVAVALSRPPHADRWSKVVVEAESESEAVLVACWMAHRSGTVMVVHAEVVDLLEI